MANLTRNLRDQANYQNWQTYFQWEQRLTLLSTSIFEWVNTPDTVNQRYLERTLFYRGQTLFFKDKSKYKLGFLALPVSNYGDLNVYGEHTTRQPIAMNGVNILVDENGKQVIYDDSDSIVIWNNDIKYPTYPFVQQYAERIAENQRSIDVNIKNQKFPVIITGSEKSKMSLVNMYNQYNGNVPAIFGYNQGQRAAPIEAINTNYPFVADKLQTNKKAELDEFLTFLGIHTANTAKKERLNESEVFTYDQFANMCAQTFYLTRKRFCEKARKLWPDELKDIDVRFRNPDMNSITALAETPPDGSDNNGSDA